MGSEVSKIQGFIARGGEVPVLDPNAIVIVGLDEDQTEENWYAFCPRVDDDIEPEFVADIEARGVQDPVHVYKDGPRYVLLAGRRRVRAAREVWATQQKAGVPAAKRITVRALLHKGDAQALFAINVSENSHRKDMSSVQRALLMAQGKKYGATDVQVASAFGVTGQTVKNLLKVLDLATDVQKAVDAGTLPLHQAIKLADEPRERQKEILKELQAAGATKGSAATNGINKAKKGEKVKHTDKTRMLPKAVIEGWRDHLAKVRPDDRPEVDPCEILNFVLGGPLPRGIEKNEVLRNTLVEAGFKMKATA